MRSTTWRSRGVQALHLGRQKCNRLLRRRSKLLGQPQSAFGLPKGIDGHLLQICQTVGGAKNCAMEQVKRLTKAARMSLCSGIEQELKDFVSARRKGLFLYIWVTEPHKLVFAVSPLIPRLELCDIEGLPTFH